MSLTSLDKVVATKVTLKKQIGLLQSVAIIVGIIIGSGIFVSPVGILTNVKSVGMSCVMWAVCGVFSGLCALCYAELGASIPQSGGEYVYIKRAFGDFPGFLCLWINFIIICPGGIAASSLIFATYVSKPMFPDCDTPQTALRLLSALVVTLLVSINCINVKWSTKVQVVITTSKLAALFMIIIIGFIRIGKGDIENFKDAFADSDVSAGSIAIAFYSGFWAFGGWSYLNFLTDELVEPHKNLPRAIVISITIVTFVYLVANIAYFAVLTPMKMLESSAVAVTFSDETIPSFAWITPILIAISVMGSINGNSLSMSRLFMTGAENNHLPKLISMINVHYLTPAPSLIVIMLLTVLMQSFEEIFYLIELMGFGFSMVLTCVFNFFKGFDEAFHAHSDPNHQHNHFKFHFGGGGNGQKAQFFNFDDLFEDSDDSDILGFDPFSNINFGFEDDLFGHHNHYDQAHNAAHHHHHQQMHQKHHKQHQQMHQAHVNHANNMHQHTQHMEFASQGGARCRTVTQRIGNMVTTHTECS